MSSDARLTSSGKSHAPCLTVTVAPKEPNVVTSKIPHKELRPSPATWILFWKWFITEKYSLFLFWIPRSYSIRVYEVNQIHVHKLQDTPIKTHISCTLSTRIQRKNRFKSARKWFEINRKIFSFQPLEKTDKIRQNKESHLLTHFHGRQNKHEN